MATDILRSARIDRPISDRADQLAEPGKTTKKLGLIHQLVRLSAAVEPVPRGDLSFFEPVSEY